MMAEQGTDLWYNQMSLEVIVLVRAFSKPVLFDFLLVPGLFNFRPLATQRMDSILWSGLHVKSDIG